MNNVAGAGTGTGVSIDDILGTDCLVNIISRFPAKQVQSLASVNMYWNSMCKRILSAPKLTSALSLNPIMDNAITEVIEKLLAKPIRPQFAIATVGPPHFLERAHRLINGSPVVTAWSAGIMGRDAQTNEFEEVRWRYRDILDSGFLLTLGHLPGLQVDLIPLKRNKDGTLLIPEFVGDIREYTSSVSASASIEAIILFTDTRTDVRPVLEEMDHAFPSATIIVSSGGELLYKSKQGGCLRRREHFVPAVALVFVKDRDRAADIGETEFFFALARGMRQVGPTYEATYADNRDPDGGGTYVSVRREAENEDADFSILDNIERELGDRIGSRPWFIGAKKQGIMRRKPRMGVSGPCYEERITFMEFHEILEMYDQQPLLFVLFTCNCCGPSRVRL